MGATAVLLHSPLVGAGSWTKVVPLLRAAGFFTIVPDLSPAFGAGPPYHEQLAGCAARAIADTGRDGPAVLVAHSGAGALVPSIIAHSNAVAGVVFADALLPHPGRNWYSTAPDAVVTRLRGLARGERMPPWHEWWPQGAIETLLNDKTTYEAFVAELPEVPLPYFSEIAPPVDVPKAMACAYLQWSEACRGDADLAEERGWFVQRRNLNHLAMLTHPGDVARDLHALVDNVLGVRT